MIPFLIVSLAAYCAVWLSAPLACRLLRRAGVLPDQSTETQTPALWILAAPAVAAVAVYLALVGALTNWSFLESAHNLRVLLGSLFGLLLWQLLRGSADRCSPTDTARSADAPWWARPRSLAALALIALPLVAFVAPHGELDLGFLRSVKTPFVEAQFAQNETEMRFRFELESEPQGFFQVGLDGLGSPLHAARNELNYQRYGRRFPDQSVVQAAEDAFGFIADVLQPVALCVHAVDRLYGDRELLVQSLHRIGAALARAVVISAAPWNDGSESREDFLADKVFTPTLTEVHTQAKLQLPALLGADLVTATPTALVHPCGQDYADKLNHYRGKLGSVMRHPAVVYASAMVFLWSGNPRAALQMIDNLMKGSFDEAWTEQIKAYPGLYHIRGFARRWISGQSGDPQDYLDEWAKGIAHYQARLQEIEHRWPQVISECGKQSRGPVILRQSDIVPAAVDEPAGLPENCSSDTVECHVRLAYGFFAYQAFKLRNHLVYESARELLTGRSFPSRVDVLERGLWHADALKDLVDGDRLRSGGCYAQQVLRLDAEALAVWVDDALKRQAPIRIGIGSKNPDSDYAFAVDTYGNLLLAGAYFDKKVESAEAEAAIVAFRRALLHGQEGKLDATSMAKIREHLDQARRAIGLTE